jgi:heme/copper-type cytochrome/quinol oxidase subunit 1
MPRLSVYFIRASLLYLLFGFTLGGLLLANKGFLISPVVWTLLPLHIEFDLMGWMVQLAMGVAFWILPRFSKRPLRGNERLSWLSFLLINSGILVVASETIFELKWLIFTGRAIEALSLVLFAAGNWRRIKPHGVG